MALRALMPALVLSVFLAACSGEARPFDSGSLDADASVEDAALPDDAGSSDAGPSDGGPPDAASADAAPEVDASLRCAANQRVEDGRCVDCPVGGMRPAGDDASGEDTACTCEDGFEGDGTTVCTEVVCEADQRVEDHACVACPANGMRPAGDGAAGDDTACTCATGTVGDGVVGCEPVCGDGLRVGAEACDDGNTATETECEYGVDTCEACDATCATVLTLSGPTCGDGVRQASEACDDGVNAGARTGDCLLCRGLVSDERIIRVSRTLTTGDFDSRADPPSSKADLMCSFLGNYRAMFADAARRATVTPYRGDGQIDWVIAPFVAYYNTLGEHVWTTDASALLGVRDGAPADLLAPITDGWSVWTGMHADYTTLQPAFSCDRWTRDAVGASGRTGDSASLDRFIEDTPRACLPSLPVYCVEQP